MRLFDSYFMRSAEMQIRVKKLVACVLPDLPMSEECFRVLFYMAGKASFHTRSGGGCGRRTGLCEDLGLALHFRADGSRLRTKWICHLQESECSEIENIIF